MTLSDTRTYRLSRERPPFPKPNAAASSSSSGMPAYPFEPLDLVKFLCRDVWQSVYQKQIDNLRTNHKGVFVIQDISFPPLRLFSCSFDMDEERERMRLKMLDVRVFCVSGVERERALKCKGICRRSSCPLASLEALWPASDCLRPSHLSLVKVLELVRCESLGSSGRPADDDGPTCRCFSDQDCQELNEICMNAAALSPHSVSMPLNIK